MAKIFNLVYRKYSYFEFDDQIDHEKKLLIGHNNSIWINILWRAICLVVQI